MSYIVPMTAAEVAMLEFVQGLMRDRDKMAEAANTCNLAYALEHNYIDTADAYEPFTPDGDPNLFGRNAVGALAVITEAQTEAMTAYAGKGSIEKNFIDTLVFYANFDPATPSSPEELRKVSAVQIAANFGWNYALYFRPVEMTEVQKLATDTLSPVVGAAGLRIEATQGLLVQRANVFLLLEHEVQKLDLTQVQAAAKWWLAQLAEAGYYAPKQEQVETSA